MTENTVFPDVRSGAIALLIETVECVTGIGEPFVVVGGWSPVLLNSHRIPHPGTIDVDLLFREGATENALQGVVEALLADGFLPSAKHRFQLLKVLNVGEHRLVYHVDLLHPTERISEKPAEAELFVDHIELKIPVELLSHESLRAKSIAAPHSGFIFPEKRFVEERVSVVDVDGVEYATRVPVIDEVALVVSKSLSAATPKRPRDSFDIYLAVAHARDPDALHEGGAMLKEKAPEAFFSMARLWSILDDGSFDRRVHGYMPTGAADNIEAAVREGRYSTPVREYLKRIQVPHTGRTAE
jgi:hypothetical protein